MRERNKQFSFRLYQSELNKIKAKAKRCGLAVSEYIRNCALDRKVMEMPLEGLRSAYSKTGNVIGELQNYSDSEKEIAILREVQAILLDLYHGNEVTAIGDNQDMADKVWSVSSHKVRK